MHRRRPWSEQNRASNKIPVLTEAEQAEIQHQNSTNESDTQHLEMENSMASGIQNFSNSNLQELNVDNPVELDESNGELNFCNIEASNEPNVLEEILLEDSDNCCSEDEDDEEYIVSII